MNPLGQHNLPRAFSCSWLEAVVGRRLGVGVHQRQGGCSGVCCFFTENWGLNFSLSELFDASLLKLMNIL